MTRNGGRELKSAILDEARRLLLEEGYPHLSMRKIAHAVDCTATSIYLHFQNKDDLFQALVVEGFDRLHERLEEALRGDGNPRERLKRMLWAYVDFGLGNPGYYEIMFLLHPARMERFPSEKYRRARENLELFAGALAAMCPESGPEGELLLPATVIWTSLHGTVSLVLSQRIDRSLERDELIEETIRHAMTIAETSGALSVRKS